MKRAPIWEDEGWPMMSHVMINACGAIVLGDWIESDMMVFASVFVMLGVALLQLALLIYTLFVGVVKEGL
jgi:hypothetical protein